MYLFQANALGGRNEKAVKEFLEKTWTDGLTETEAVRLTVKALLEVVDSGSKNMEIAVMRFHQRMEVSCMILSCFTFFFSKTNII